MRQLGHAIVWILIVCIFAIAAALITVYQDYPIWQGILIFIGLILIFLILDGLTWAVRKWYKNRKNAQLKAAGEKVETAGLRLTLKNALQYIEDNHVAGGEQRFWQMPWVIFFGKSALLRTSGLRLHTHFMVGDAEDEAQQRNQVYVLDNFVVWCVDEDLLEGKASKKIESQWLDFLKYIKKHNRSKPPIDQVVVELPASMLLNGDKSDVAYSARSLKDRIDQVSLLTGYRQQVLFCISQCNDLSGFREFVELVPEKLRNQAMGCVVSNPLKDSTSVWPLNYITNRADEVIDISLFENNQSVKNIEVFNFPLTIKKLAENYSRFTNIFFAPSEYTEAAVLLGVYMVGEYKVAGQEEGVFYYDLVDEIQLSLMRPMWLLQTEIAQQKSRQWKRLGLWYLLCAIAATYLILVYNHTSNRLVELVKMLPKKESFSDQLEQNLLQFNDFHNLMTELNVFRNQWQILVLPYEGGLNRLYRYYSQQYVETFKTNILNLLDRRMLQILRRQGLTDNQIVYLVQNMVARINLIQARLGGFDSPAIRQLPDPQIRFMGYDKLPERFLGTFGLLYKDYIIWNDNAEDLRAESGKLIQWLDQSRFFSSNLHWLLAWGNTQDGLLPVGLNNFWLGSLVVRDYEIAPAYTVDGLKAIYQLLAEIENALPLYMDISRQKSNFRLWYSEGRLSEWKRFSLNFYKGTQTLAYQFEWDQTFDTMLQPEGPFNVLLRELAVQFQHKLLVTTPRWIELVRQFSDLLNFRYDSDNGLEFKQISNAISQWMQKLAERPSQLQGQSTRATPPKVASKLNFNMQVNAAKAYINYRNILKKLYKYPYVQSVKAYTNARELYLSQIQAGKQNSLVMQAYQALVDMRRILDRYDQLDDSNPFWLLMRGPLDFYIDYTNRYASCFIQQKWLDEIYLKTIALDGSEINHALFGKGGLAWEFNNQYALPFVKQIGSDFMPRYVLNHRFPFTNQYYQFLSFGTKINNGLDTLAQIKKNLQEKLPIELTISAKPTNVDFGAKALPFKTVLMIKCNDKQLFLENYNYPSQHTIPKWNLDTCGPTEIDLHFPTVTLVIQYPGNDGFLKFLQDFDRGGKSFYADRFPNHLKFLRDNKISQIRVSYAISGAGNVMWEISKYLAAERAYRLGQEKMADNVKIPRAITECGEQN